MPQPRSPSNTALLRRHVCSHARVCACVRLPRREHGGHSMPAAERGCPNMAWCRQLSGLSGEGPRGRVGGSSAQWVLQLPGCR